MTSVTTEIRDGQSMKQSAYQRWGKRVFDLVVAIPVSMVAAPVVGLAALAVKAETRGPAFFRQTRAGKDAREFTIYKVRTMVDGNTVVGQVMNGNASVTRVGSVLRRLKVDELPQLWNVLTGDMSVVGPRPCLPETVREVDENGRWRFKVRPGLTGLAQVNGNIHLTWPERWVYDRAYVENLSLKQDLSIMARTVGVILEGDVPPRRRESKEQKGSLA